MMYQFSYLPTAPGDGFLLGMLHDLTDTGEPSVTLINDQVNGYTVEGIFRGFDQGSTTVPALRDAILANNGNSQAVQVNNLSGSYGW